MDIHQIQRGDADFQRPVDDQDLRAQLRRELAGETISVVTELEAGLFNNCYRVDTPHSAYILKVAPSHDADVFYCERKLMQRERSIARELESLSPLIPKYLSFFTVGGRDAFLQPLVPGRLWHDEIPALSEQENALLWAQLGTFANRLHSSNGEQFGYPPPSEGFTRWSGFIFDNVEGLVEDCRRHNVLHEEVTAYRRNLLQLRTNLDQVDTPRLLHGDLWPRNVIIDGVGTDIHIKAVIDAERAFHGDPISDWVLLLYGVPDAFWQGYGGNLLESSDPVRVALYKGMYYILNILEALRFDEPGIPARQRLASINDELVRLLHL